MKLLVCHNMLTSPTVKTVDEINKHIANGNLIDETILRHGQEILVKTYNKEFGIKGKLVFIVLDTDIDNFREGLTMVVDEIKPCVDGWLKY